MDNKTLQPGHRLNGTGYVYVIEKVLGRGGFGITYLASTTVKIGNVEMSVRFAIKEHFINSDCERDAGTSRVIYSAPAKERVENSLKDFISEAGRLQKVGANHKNIVSVNEIFEANNTAYYVMEYLDGESLMSYIARKGRLSEKEMLEVLIPIRNAVSALHAQNMTHLDIKPDNIMIVRTNDGAIRPVLIDFGLSKHYDREGTPTSTINTLGCSDGFSPIEQYTGITTFSPTADIYAFGATVYYCLTGRNPKKSSELREDELAGELKEIASAETIEDVRRSTKLSKFDREKNISNLFSSKSQPGRHSDNMPAVEPKPIHHTRSDSTVSINRKSPKHHKLANKNLWIVWLAVGFCSALLYIAIRYFSSPENVTVPLPAETNEVVEEEAAVDFTDPIEKVESHVVESPAPAKNDYFSTLSQSELRQDVKNFILSYYDAVDQDNYISFFEDEDITFFGLEHVNKSAVRKKIQNRTKRDSEHDFDWSTLTLKILPSGYVVATYSSDYYIHYDTKIDRYFITTEMIISPEFKIKSLKDTTTKKVESLPIEY